MKIYYKCKCCDEREIIVTDRVKGSSVLDYIEVVKVSVAYDHKARNPKCRQYKMEYVKLPADNPDGIAVPKVVN